VLNQSRELEKIVTRSPKPGISLLIMNTAKTAKFIVPVFFGLIITWVIFTNNSLVQKEETVNQTWAQVENVYQRRADLVPNLVNTVKGYAKHEKETLEGVIQARNLALSASGQAKAAPGSATSEDKVKTFAAAQDTLGAALSRLMVVVERYPELKANENFRDLQSQLEGSENRIAVERRRFNEAVQTYNSTVRSFPTSVVAGFRGFEKKAYFEAAQGSDVAPKVDF